MRKFGLMIVAALAVLGMSSANAQDRGAKDTRFCSGGKTGMYYQVAGEIGRRLGEMGYKVARVETPGSVANLRMMMTPGEKTCDIAVAQNDAIRNFTSKNPDARSAIVRGAPLYEEAVHLLCNKQFADKQGISRITDLRKFGSGSKVNFSIAVGSSGSGVNETWLSISAADKDYANIPTTTDSGIRAADKVADGSDVQCMLYTAALNTGLMKDINENYKGKLVLVRFDDGDLDNAKDQTGKPIYRLGDIPGGTYKNLQEWGFTCGGSCAVKTAYVAAHLVYTTEWDHRSDGVTDLIKAKNAAVPTIEAMIAGRK